MRCNVLLKTLPTAENTDKRRDRVCETILRSHVSGPYNKGQNLTTACIIHYEFELMTIAHTGNTCINAVFR